MAWDPQPGSRGRLRETAACNHQTQIAARARPLLGTFAGGRLLSAISTRFVKLLREHYGRGPIKAKTYALDDIIVVVMRGPGSLRSRRR